MMAPAEFHDFQAHQTIAALQAEVGAIKQLLGDRNGDSKVSGSDNNLIDHKIALSEARQETKLTRLEGKIELLAASINTLGTKIDSQRSEASASRNLLMVTVIGTAISMMALIYAILSYGASTFTSGTTVRDIVHSEISAAKPTGTGTPSRQ